MFARLGQAMGIIRPAETEASNQVENDLDRSIPARPIIDVFAEHLKNSRFAEAKKLLPKLSESMTRKQISYALLGKGGISDTIISPFIRKLTQQQSEKSWGNTLIGLVVDINKPYRQGELENAINYAEDCQRLPGILNRAEYKNIPGGLTDAHIKALRSQFKSNRFDEELAASKAFFENLRQYKKPTGQVPRIFSKSDLDAKNTDGKTALQISIRLSNKATTQLLLSKMTPEQVITQLQNNQDYATQLNDYLKSPEHAYPRLLAANPSQIKAPKGANIPALSTTEKSQIYGSNSTLKLSDFILEKASFLSGQEKSSLRQLLNNVETEADFLAVPKEATERKKFYAAMRLNMEHIALALANPEIPEETKKTAMAVVLEGVGYCATKQFQGAALARQILTKPIDEADNEAQETRVANILYQLRSKIISNILATESRGQYEGNHVHYYNAIMELIGEEAGVATSGSAYSGDTHKPKLDKDSLIANFRSQYNTSAIIEEVRKAIDDKQVGFAALALDFLKKGKSEAEWEAIQRLIYQDPEAGNYELTTVAVPYLLMAMRVIAPDQTQTSKYPSPQFMKPLVVIDANRPLQDNDVREAGEIFAAARTPLDENSLELAVQTLVDSGKWTRSQATKIAKNLIFLEDLEEPAAPEQQTQAPKQLTAVELRLLERKKRIEAEQAEARRVLALGTGAFNSIAHRLNDKGRQVFSVDGTEVMFKPDGVPATAQELSTRSAQDNSAYDSSVSEIAAYQFDRLLGFNLVPPASSFQHEGQRGSLHRLLVGMKQGDQTDVATNKTTLQVFDYLIGNDDRHPGNWLYDERQQKRIAIDNGMAFRGMTTGGFFKNQLYVGPRLAIDAKGPYNIDERALGLEPDPAYANAYHVDLRNLDPVIKERLQTIRPEEIEAVLKKASIDDAEIQSVLSRLDRLRQAISTAS